MQAAPLSARGQEIPSAFWRCDKFTTVAYTDSLAERPGGKTLEVTTMGDIRSLSDYVAGKPTHTGHSPVEIYTAMLAALAASLDGDTKLYEVIMARLSEQPPGKLCTEALLPEHLVTRIERQDLTSAFVILAGNSFPEEEEA